MTPTSPNETGTFATTAPVRPDDRRPERTATYRDAVRALLILCSVPITFLLGMFVGEMAMGSQLGREIRHLSTAQNIGVFIGYVLIVLPIPVSAFFSLRAIARRTPADRAIWLAAAALLFALALGTLFAIVTIAGNT